MRTIGSYWPYATTLYDYTARAMPFQQPSTLTPDETYAVVAYLLFLNGVIAEDAVMDQSSLSRSGCRLEIASSPTIDAVAGT